MEESEAEQKSRKENRKCKKKAMQMELMWVVEWSNPGPHCLLLLAPAEVDKWNGTGMMHKKDWLHWAGKEGQRAGRDVLPHQGSCGVLVG